MPEEDFDIESLAAYLHLNRAQVSKMVERGKLPGRRIGGAWRFSRAEIHHWLEDRIGVGDEALSKVEQVLERSHGATDTISIHNLIPEEAIGVPLMGRTREKVMRSMIDLAASTGMLWDPEKMLEAVRNRESMHTTAMENGVALLHSRRPMSNILAEPFVALGVSPSGVPFANARGLLTDVYFLILSTEDSGHLRVLARLSRLIVEPDFLPTLRGAASPSEARAMILEAEERLDA